MEFNFLKLPQAFCTGSSIMPQKVNPDVLELIRGKTARVIGSLQTLLVLVKGLPLAYNRDLQEDKRPIFDAFDTVKAALELAAPLVARTELNRASIAEKLDRGHLDATTLMEFFIARGVPQRTAHGMVGHGPRGLGPQPAPGRLAAGLVPGGLRGGRRDVVRRVGRGVATVAGCKATDRLIRPRSPSRWRVGKR